MYGSSRKTELRPHRAETYANRKRVVCPMLPILPIPEDLAAELNVAVWCGILWWEWE